MYACCSYHANVFCVVNAPLVHRQCVACRNGALFYAPSATCIMKNQCPTSNTVYAPRPYYATCEPAFTCSKGVKDTTGKPCRCNALKNKDQAGCTRCFYGPQKIAAFSNGPTCSGCVGEKFLVLKDVNGKAPTSKWCLFKVSGVQCGVQLNGMTGGVPPLRGQGRTACTKLLYSSLMCPAVCVSLWCCFRTSANAC